MQGTVRLFFPFLCKSCVFSPPVDTHCFRAFHSKVKLVVSAGSHTDSFPNGDWRGPLRWWSPSSLLLLLLLPAVCHFIKDSYWLERASSTEATLKNVTNIPSYLWLLLWLVKQPFTILFLTSWFLTSFPWWGARGNPWSDPSLLIKDS